MAERTTEQLERALAERDAELAELRRRLAGPETTRRNLLKGGAAAGGLAALGAVALAKAVPAGATPGPDVPYPGATSANLFLTANGAAIQGDVTLDAFAGAIEVHYFQHAVNVAVQGTGRVSGQRTHTPIMFRKHTDKSTPLLIQAVVQQQVVTTEFHFVHPSERGDETYFTVETTGGRIVSVNEYSPDNQSESGQTPGAPRMEEIGVTFNTIRWTFVDGGVVFEDIWNPTS